jgi:hypothetical protein
MAEINQGLYIAVGVRSPELSGIIRDCPRSVGVRIDPAEAHVTVAFPDDFTNSGIVTTDRARFTRVQQQISQEIGELGLNGVPISPEEPVVRFFRRLVGVAIAPDDDIIQCVNLITNDAVREEFGKDVKFVPQRECYHLAIARRPEGAVWLRSDMLPKLSGPDSLLAGGYQVTVRDAYDTPEQRKQARNEVSDLPAV